MIKKTFFLLFFIVSIIVCSAQPDITKVSFSDKADVYGLYVVSFDLGNYDHPYDPEVIDVFADFHSPEGKSFRVNGFYYEGYNFMEKRGVEVTSRNGDEDGWRIRFTPDAVGQWTYEIHAVDRYGSVHLSSYDGKPFAFACQSENAEGFIRKANTKYLKREAYVDGQRQDHSFFPVGSNMGWYTAADYGIYKKPYGVYEYEKFVDQLSGKANYLRIWLNRYQSLSLYGPEHAGTMDGKPQMYFDSTMNQKDAAELDIIIQDAQKHGISIMVCFFNFRDFIHKNEIAVSSKEKPAMPSDWINNPFHTILGLNTPYDFFTDVRAVRITKNMIRYIVARWGYATNVLCWELWNEVANMSEKRDVSLDIQQKIVQWHIQMAEYIRSIDPHHHLISTSLGSGEDISVLMRVFDDMDFVQDHNYQNIQKAKSKEQFSHVLYRETEKARQRFSDKPFFMGEFAFGQTNSKAKYDSKDPKGIDLHNSLWSSVFSGSMGPASFWYWEVLDKNNWYGLFKPMNVFLGSLPILSDSFTGKTTGTAQGHVLSFPNNLETYYLVNATEDTIIGWSQDTAFCYQSLRRLTDEVGKNGHFLDDGVFDPEGYVYTLDKAKRPKPSSKSNTIEFPIENQQRKTSYKVRWFDSETGLEMSDEATMAVVRRKRFRNVLEIQFPSSVRNVKKGEITNTLGDAVFMLTKISD